MRSPLPVLALLLLPVATAFSQDARPARDRPTAESVRHLFEVMHTSQMLDTVMSQVETNMHASMDQVMRGQRLSEQQAKIREDLRAKVLALVKEELDWPKLEPMIVEVYRDTFTAGEIAGMLKFYDSPTGQAVTAKLPQATRQMMQLMRERTRELTPRIMQLRKDATDQMKAAGNAGADARTSQPPAPASPPPPSAPPPSPH